jgi:two-component system chemotaxis response regulator CheB
MINVLIVDDSALVRQVLSDVISAEPGMSVFASAGDPVQAMQRLQVAGTWPDVILLDVEMPRMDGLTFLRKIMSERPTPVVMCSTLTEKGAQTTLDALAAGAVGVVAKPKLGVKQALLDEAGELIAMVKAAARANIKRMTPVARQRPLPVVEKHTADVILPAAAPTSSPTIRTTERVVAIGTSTGGTQALEVLLTRLPRVSPGIVIVQHMPADFTAAFATRLNGLCEIEVKEAASGDRVLPGRALIAPGGRHMLLERNGTHYQVSVVDGPVVNRHRPSVDVLFRSVARAAGGNALGIILTGMGDDGARGLLEMRNAGARTIAQDEDSCVVYGMPKEAVKRGAVEKSVTLTAIDREILHEL